MNTQNGQELPSVRKAAGVILVSLRTPTHSESAQLIGPATEGEATFHLMLKLLSLGGYRLIHPTNRDIARRGNSPT